MADDKKLYDILQDLSFEAHEKHVYVTDQEKHGSTEVWEVDLEGDCEDFALWIKRELKERHGIESNLVQCLTENGVGHLVVSIDGWIIDNRNKWVMDKDDVNYEWIKVGYPDGTWYKIEE